MHVITERVLGADLIAEIYPSYVQAWDHVLPHVAARHVLTFDEFTFEMTDERIDKLLVIDDGDEHVLAMTTLCNDISAVPWANADFYRSRFASEIDRGVFFYIGYTVVHRPERRTRAIYLMVTEVDRRVRAVHGVIGFDMASINTTRGFGRRLERLFPSSERIDPLDTQSYFVADYRPAAAPTAPAAPMSSSYQVVALTDRHELLSGVAELLASRWPAFMLAGRPGHDVVLPDLLARHPELQVALIDSGGAMRGIGLAVPVAWDGSVADLPAGWDDAVTQSAKLDPGRALDTVSALSITIAPELTGRGLGTTMITGMVDAARQAGAGSVIAPVRPSLKARYPLIDIEDYLSWRTGGEVFDPWVRSHLKLGAEVLGVSRTSMTITGTVHEWEGWLGLRLPGSGRFVISGGLAPLEVDVDEDLAVYREPNVWMHHRL